VTFNRRDRINKIMIIHVCILGFYIVSRVSCLAFSCQTFILCQSLENCLVLWLKADLSSQLYSLVYYFYKPSKVAYVD
jgi:hypothetical protein